MLRVLLALACLGATSAPAAWHFTDVTTEAGVLYQHGYAAGAPFNEAADHAGGIAAGDYDGDGWIDLYAVRGDIGPNLLFRNRGDGTFEERGGEAGVALAGERGCGPLFADLDGDGWLDLFVGGVNGATVHLFRNRGDGTFEDVTTASGLAIPAGRDTFGATAGDYDRDGDLDLFLPHWSSSYFNLADTSSYHLWKNGGAGTFTDATLAAGIVPLAVDARFESFTGNFVDVDADGWPDLLVAADFGTTRVYRNLGNGTFTDVTDRQVVTDGNGMGMAIGDYDEDGDFDWFVSSIWDPNDVAEGMWDTSGNRLYRNLGDGTFADATEAAGVRRGYWGWGATFQDLDDDGHLDLFHVNGFGDVAFPGTAEFIADPARLFVGNGDGTFVERAALVGVADPGEGRGVVAFDYDRDGDLDLFVANNGGAARLFRNDETPGRAVTVRLHGRPPNTEGIGAIVDATVAGAVKRRLVRAGSNYVSQDPAEVHVGVGAAEALDAVAVRWPSGAVTTVGTVSAAARLAITEPRSRTPPCGVGTRCVTGGGARRTDCLLEWGLFGGTTSRRGVPRPKVVCQEGDPACDVDTTPGDGRCVFRVTPCVNVDTPPLRACRPRPIESVRVESPAPGSIDVDDAANRTRLVRALVPLGLLPTGVSPSARFTNPTTNLCLDPVEIAVPARAGRPGHPRPGTRRLVVRVTAAGVPDDVDTILLRCRPPAG